MISLRPGKGSPEEVATGNANAAASDTTPRIPDQADNGGMLPNRVGIAGAKLPAEIARHIGRQKDPQNSVVTTTVALTAARVEQQRRPGFFRSPLTTAGKLQADQDENYPIEQKDHHAPERKGFQAGSCRSHQWRSPPDVETRGNHREDAGKPETLGRKISHEGVSNEIVI